jgi:hypothetical protein
VTAIVNQPVHIVHGDHLPAHHHHQTTLHRDTTTLVLVEQDNLQISVVVRLMVLMQGWVPVDSEEDHRKLGLGD